MLEHPPPEHITVTPEPTEAEMVAIIAAFDLFYPDEPAPNGARPVSTAWRFSGRWWAGGVGERGLHLRW